MGNIAEDLSNRVFDTWIVINRVYDCNDVGVYWSVKCICGCNEVNKISAKNLKRGGYPKLCKYQLEKIELEKEKELINKKNNIEYNKRNKYNNMIFGNLLVTGYNSRCDKTKLILYNVECQCENKTKLIVSGHDLKTGKKDNCGCLTHSKMRKSKKKHNEYDLSGEFGVGYTNKGEEFYFDLEDYDKIKEYCWIYHYNRNAFYIEARDINGSKKNVKMHRLVMDAKNGEYVDHIYHKNNDNRKSQLRITTNQQNCFNHKTHSHNTHGNKGLTQRNNGKWRARIWVDYKCISLGNFDGVEDAISARKDAEIKYFGDYAFKEG